MCILRLRNYKEHVSYVDKSLHMLAEPAIIQLLHAGFYGIYSFQHLPYWFGKIQYFFISIL